MYNKVNALIYELILFLCKFYPLKRKPWVRRILQYCLDDWAVFRAEVAIKDIDKQVENLHAAWDLEEKNKNLFTLSYRPMDLKLRSLLVAR